MNNYRKVFLISLVVVISMFDTANAQVSINTDGSSPDSSAILELKSNTKGLLIPRMTTLQIQSICGPADGLQVYNADSGKLYIFVLNYNEWKEVKYGTGTLIPFADISLGTGGMCNNTIVMGTYTQGVYLTSAEYVTLEVDVLTLGSYAISTDTLNGYHFSASGTFSNTGINYINLAGTGLPYLVQTDTFTVTGYNGGGTCTFSVTVVPSGGGPTCGIPFTDNRDGKSYETEQIGTQCWMTENLNIGIRINGVNNQTDNSIIEKYCYNDDTANCTTYGGLYQWDEMMQYVTTEGTQGICPNGWHLPTDEEWKTLEMYLGMSQSEADDTGWRGTDEGEKMKSTSGWLNNGNGTNSSGFNALPGGFRHDNETFNGLGYYSFWWLSSEGPGTYEWYRSLYDGFDQVERDDNYNKPYGFSVRCIKN